MRLAVLAGAAAVAAVLGGCSYSGSGQMTPAAAFRNPAAADDASQMPGALPHFVGTYENQDAAARQAAKDEAAAAAARNGAPAPQSGSSVPPAGGAPENGLIDAVPPGSD